MFAYCNNNPIVGYDGKGEFLGTLIGAVVGGICGAAGAIMEGETDPKEIWANAASGAVSGAISGLASDVILVTGGTAAVVIGVYAAAGGVGGILGELTKQKVKGDTRSASERGMDVIKEGVRGAFWGGVFGAVEGPVESMMGHAVRTAGKKAARQGVTVGKAITKAWNRELRGFFTSSIKEAVSNFTSWYVGFGIRSVLVSSK